MQKLNSSVAVSSETLALKPRSIDGWALPLLLRLDGPEHLLRFAMTASALRRQAIFLSLALIEGDEFGPLAERIRSWSDEQIDDDAAMIAHALTRWRVQRLVQANFDTTPLGLCGALAKLGETPMSHPASYLKLCDVLAGQYGVAKARIILQARTITSDLIDIAILLDPVLARPGVIETIKYVRTVHQINRAVELIRSICNSASDEALGHSIPPAKDWKHWASRWLSRADRFPLQPVIEDDGIEVLDSAEKLRDAGAVMRNCLQSRTAAAALGRVAYLHVKEPSAIVSLQAMSEGRWRLQGIHVHNNGSVDTETRVAVWEQLQRHGILVSAGNAEAARWTPVVRLIGDWELDDDVDVIGDDPGQRWRRIG